MLFVVVTRTLVAAGARVADVPYEHHSQKADVLAVADHMTRLVLRSTPHDVRETLVQLLTRIARAVEKHPPRAIGTAQVHSAALSIDRPWAARWGLMPLRAGADGCRVFANTSSSRHPPRTQAPHERETL